tara:strand:+ start:347 stop:1015 length:669 start_codon:yes stop_codon:yes gene_type:complete
MLAINMYDFHNFALTPMQDLFLNVVILSSLIFAILKGERALEKSSPFTVLAIITTFCIAGRILLEPIPNVQPVTVTIILVGIFFGAPWAIAISGIVVLSTNLLFLGHGPWTIFQVFGWGFLGLTSSYFSQHLLIDGKIAIRRMLFFAVASAFVFDWIVSTSILLNNDISVMIPYLVNGLSFDIYHAIGNAVFVVWLASPLGDIMARHRAELRGNSVSEIATY